MSRLLNESWIAGLPDNIVDNLEALNRYVVLRISERIKEIGDTGASNSRRLMSAIQYAGADLDAIEKEVARIMEMNQREVQRLFEEVAAENIGFANTYYAARGMEKLSSYRNRASLIAFVESAKRVAMDGTANLSHTHMIGFKRGKQIVPLREYYISAIDRAVTFVQTGTVDYNTAMRSTVREMARSGLRRVTFDSGYSRRLDSQARMNILEGVRRLNAGMMAETGKEFGADGVEISVHGLCAPDHQPIQGRQYPDREYEVLNNSLRRRIGTLNCGHTALPVILGVNRPQYSREELEQFRADNEKGVEIDGVHYTGYEAAQMQRRLERAIRAQKRRVMVDEASGDAGDQKKLAQDKTRLNILHQRYARFSKAAGLKTQYERTEVAGFGENAKQLSANDILRNAHSKYGGGFTMNANDGILSEKDIYAIYQYMSSGVAYSLNSILRGEAPMTEHFRQIVHDIDQAILKLPIYQGTVYRSIGSEDIEDIEAFWQRYRPGEFVPEGAYVSSSTEVYDPTADIQMIIQSKRGRDMRKFNPMEQEILFRRGTMFFVEKLEGNTLWLIEV